MIDFETFHGQPELEIAVNDQAFDEPVEAVNRHLSNLGANHFMQLANEPERFGSMQYGLLWGDDDRSSKAVIPMPAPFGNGVWPHILARAEAIRFMAAEAGLHDRQGNPVPILVTAAPSMHSAFDILPQDVTYLKKHGDFGSIAAKHVYLMNRLGFGCVAGFAGYSQGSVIGSPLMEVAQSVMDTTGNVVLGAPPHAEQRPFESFGLGMLLDGMHFKSER
ncbi:MAG TPA: hypothetical protein VLF87_01090, partial [Patescibacteria group bacterium]|nr:hypothetical protein [Patescibacteria group bacterium]